MDAIQEVVVKGVSFHNFPKKHAEKVKITNGLNQDEYIDRRKAWLQASKRRKVSPSSKVCSKHFKKSDYFLPDYNKQVRRLKRTAVPSENLPKVPYYKSPIKRALPVKVEDISFDQLLGNVHGYSTGDCSSDSFQVLDVLKKLEGTDGQTTELPEFSIANIKSEVLSNEETQLEEKETACLLVQVKTEEIEYDSPQEEPLQFQDTLQTLVIKIEPQEQSGNEAFSCNLCHLSFKNHFSLKEHLNYHVFSVPISCKAGSKRLFKCSCCFRFSVESQLKEHSLKHVDEKEHVCHFCGQVFPDGLKKPNNQRIPQKNQEDSTGHVFKEDKVLETAKGRRTRLGWRIYRSQLTPERDKANKRARCRQETSEECKIHQARYTEYQREKRCTGNIKCL